MEYATENGSIVFESLWRTRYENDVPVNEMESEHIVNTINYLSENGEDAGYHLPITDLPRTEHNIEVFKRELVRRSE